MNYFNLEGYVLLPYAPGIIGFDLPMNINVYKEKDYNDFTEIQNNFTPDEAAYDLIRKFYQSFNLESDTIPLYNNQ